MQHKGLKILFVSLVFLIMVGCDSDLFNPSKTPVIKELTLSAYEVNPGDTIDVAVEVEEDKDATLSYSWNVSEGRLIPPTDGPTISWIMPVTGGDYTIRVNVSNQDDKSSEKKATATVRSFQDPVVQITYPVDHSFFVQNESIKVLVDASHENGISAVNLYVNDVQQKTLSQESNNKYAAILDLQHWVGAIEIKVEAIARTTQTIAEDAITVNVEGIVLGK